MTTLENGRITELANEYREKGYAVIPRLVEPDLAANWELRHGQLPIKRACIDGTEEQRWIEQSFADPREALDGFAFATSFANLVTRIAGFRTIEHKWTRVWINRYSPGDRVALHYDMAGSTQLLLCLQGLVEPERGGELILRDRIVPLRTGDAVLFFARGVPHGVQRIDGDKLGPSGFSRITCVIRLFSANENQEISS